jgi:hypothetical protein
MFGRSLFLYLHFGYETHLREEVQSFLKCSMLRSVNTKTIGGYCSLN